jgi:hypothetical protein
MTSNKEQTLLEKENHTFEYEAAAASGAKVKGYSMQEAYSEIGGFGNLHHF